MMVNEERSSSRGSSPGRGSLAPRLTTGPTWAPFQPPGRGPTSGVVGQPAEGRKRHDETRFECRLMATDAFVIASPEYGASMPGHLKNAIDWVSRIRGETVGRVDWA